MCGRFTLAADATLIQEAFPWLNIPGNLQPRYNVAPSQPVALVPNDGKNQLDYFVWGLIPSWAKDPDIGNRMINARAETLAEKPSFKSSLKRKRCLILADGFYEWKQIPGQKAKLPMYIRLESGKPFAFAGLWDEWHAPDGSQVLSCTIITTEPNSMMQAIHNRMPVILPPEAYTAWLAKGEQKPETLIGLLQPYPAEMMTAYPVSMQVNSPNNDSPELIRDAG
jgi:putative SOS response-associated peptidase YedK